MSKPDSKPPTGWLYRCLDAAAGRVNRWSAERKRNINYGKPANTAEKERP